MTGSASSQPLVVCVLLRDAIVFKIDILFLFSVILLVIYCIGIFHWIQTVDKCLFFKAVARGFVTAANYLETAKAESTVHGDSASSSQDSQVVSSGYDYRKNKNHDDASSSTEDYCSVRGRDTQSGRPTCSLDANLTSASINLLIQIIDFTVSTFDVYYPATRARRELLCQKGAFQIGWHLSPSRTTTPIHSPIAFAVSLNFPHLFKEPASLEECRREWTPNAYHCYPVVPYHFRREILARLIDICAEEMKKDKNPRAGATDPKPYTKKPASSPESTNDTPASKRARIELPPTDTSGSLKREHVSLGGTRET
ncbi:hypothetical protein QM012_004050 [Aureobasidium pullulans]|uniref:Uncharacterized protein n=1 Tax=Aureobasidium pullulans TaxID=5580 RepID=A0ABR0T6K8_AURPU